MQVLGTPALSKAQRDKEIAGADFQHSFRNKMGGGEREDAKPCENVHRGPLCA